MRWLLFLILCAWCFFQVATCSPDPEKFVKTPILLSSDIPGAKKDLHNEFRAIPDAKVTSGSLAIPAILVNYYYIEDGHGGSLMVKAIQGEALPDQGQMLFITGEFKNVVKSEGVLITVFCEKTRKVLDDARR